MDKHRNRTVWTISVFVLLTTACSDDGGDLRPCPSKGIGVEDFGGFTANEQILEYQQFDCKEPQICPDDRIALYDPEYLIDENTPPAQSTIGLTNCSTGNQKLVIERVVLVGDSRCSFTCQCRLDRQEPCERCQVEIENSTVNPGETVSVAILYDPTSPGADHAAFHVFSNAQNFNPSVTPMCARAVTSLSNETADDGGVTQDGGSDSTFECEFVSEVNSACHED